MKIGDRCFVHGYIDEIRKDTVIVRNKGGYFGTDPSEVLVGELPERKTGRWIEAVEDWRHQIVWWKCSECGMDVSTQYNYCPDCGTAMIEEGAQE